MAASAVHGRLCGKHVALTGAGSGIGRALALRLGSEGAQLALFARRLALLEETARAVAAAGGPLPRCYALDITERSAVERQFAAAAKATGPFHALVANSGIGGPNAPGPEDRFEALIATNLLGTYACLRAAQNHLAPGPQARQLVVVSSILGRIGVAGYTGYCASKTGLLGLVRALAKELAPWNVEVNALCPGWVETAMAQEGLRGMAAALKLDESAARELAMREVPLGRMSQPEDVAGLVAWLLSGDARGVTGAALDMNNGAFML